MFEKARQQPTRMQQQKFIRMELQTKLERGEPIYLTEIHMMDEPWRMFGLMAIYGIVLDDTGREQRDANSELLLEPIELVTLNPKNAEKPIKQKVQQDERIAGTEKFQRTTKYKDLGTHVTLPCKQANKMIQLRGWPNINHHSNGNKTGTLVELAWLRAEAKKPDALPEVTENLAVIEKWLAAKQPKPQQRGG